jgi:hypothetical protein
VGCHPSNKTKREKEKERVRGSIGERERALAGGAVGGVVIEIEQAIKQNASFTTVK